MQKKSVSNSHLVTGWARLLAALLVLLAAAATPVVGATILLNSGSDLSGTVQYNSIGGLGTANTIITPHPAWAPPTGGAQWISYTNTGFGGSVPANSGTFGALAGTPTASFYNLFTLPSVSTGGFIRVWGDDTAAVYLNSTLLFAAATTPSDGACATGPISCQPNEGQTILLPVLGAGNHTLRFDVWQLGGGPFGLLYTGQIESQDEPVPEPATLLLLAGGLIGLGFYRRIRS